MLVPRGALYVLPCGLIVLALLDIDTGLLKGMGGLMVLATADGLVLLLSCPDGLLLLSILSVNVLDGFVPVMKIIM